ncbi:MAG: hydrogenase maturation nickel metallochaperone HypA [Planctomycetes bacterium]|nr:hydrogenase maturation nickel metallochaperone HypA [Planctomycetota bacterium]
MHETGLIKGLVRAALEAAAGGKVAAVGVRIGALSGISAAHLREHWDEALPGTPLEGAALRAETSDDPTDDGAMGVVLEWVELVGEEG